MTAVESDDIGPHYVTPSFRISAFGAPQALASAALPAGSPRQDGTNSAPSSYGHIPSRSKVRLGRGVVR